MGKFYENEMEKLGMANNQEKLERINRIFNQEFHKAKVGGRVTIIGGGEKTDTIEGTIVAVHTDLQMFEVEVDTHNGQTVSMDGNMRVFAELFDFGFDVLLFD